LGLIKNIINKAIKKYVEDYTKGVGTMQYNPLLVSMDDNHNDKHMTRRILENGIWYSGIEQDIAYFYTKQAKKFYRKGQASESINYFWADTNTNIRKVHSGFPQLISEKMVDLIIGNGFEVKVEGADELELQDLLDEILNDNKFRSLFAKAIETESWSGGCSWKISWNPEVSDYPIIEVWQPENYTNIVVSGRIVADIFYVYYDKGNIKYRLSEIYGVDKKGAYIDYKLEQLSSAGSIEDSHWITVPFNELEETKDLKRISFDGYFKRLSRYKPNKLPNSEFRNTLLGESDYSGSYGAFDAIDEILSTWIQEFRDGKLYRYFPEELMLKDSSSGEYVYPDKFKKDHVLMADSPSENMDKQKIQYSQGEIRVEKHIESYKAWVTQVINNAGLSPLTVGITGLESIDASSQSQQEREKVSIRTRNKKADTWREFFEDYLRVVLEFQLMMSGIKQNDDQTYDVNSIPEFDIIVSFNDYIIKSRADRTEEVRNGLGTSWDILTAVRYVHDNMSEREQLAVSARIKIENNINSISQAELSALQADNLDWNAFLEEQEVELVNTEEEVETEGGEIDAVADNERET
jgi:hypothetical protein